MTPSQIVDVLESRGWTAEIVNKVDVPDLVDVDSKDCSNVLMVDVLTITE